PVETPDRASCKMKTVARIRGIVNVYAIAIFRFWLIWILPPRIANLIHEGPNRAGRNPSARLAARQGPDTWLSAGLFSNAKAQDTPPHDWQCIRLGCAFYCDSRIPAFNQVGRIAGLSRRVKLLRPR